HAHIDTAWLWPIEETRRKCQRSFANVLALMEDYPEFKFACSQAAQYVMMEESDPDLFARIRARAAKGQWIPIGGSWVEPDCNLPSGESLSRQLLYGQRYFEKTFGARAHLLESRRVRLCRAIAAVDARSRHGPVPDPETVLEPLHRAAASQLPVARHRRQRGADAFPAVRHLQQHVQRRGD